MLDSHINWGFASPLSTKFCRVNDAGDSVDAIIRWRLLDSSASMILPDVSKCLKQFEDDNNPPYKGLMKIYLYDEVSTRGSVTSDWFHVAEIDMQLPIFYTSARAVAEDGRAAAAGIAATAVLPSGVQVSSAVLKSHWFSRTLRLNNLPAVSIGVKVGLSFRTYGRSCNFTWDQVRASEAAAVQVRFFATLNILWLPSCPLHANVQ
jgi:hypothetical protein